ncbi:MAG: aminoacyl-tRNA hydrolase [Anaerovoracaceae bacterium]
MYLIVGLGNPGLKYHKTRHNVGYMVIDKLAKNLGVKISKKKYNGLIAETLINGERVVLLKPATYMNLSGDSVLMAKKYLNLENEKIVIIYDDIDLETAAIRIREKGGAGTHNGMRSIISKLGDGNFPRVRVGIGNRERIPLDSFVLGKFTRIEEKKMMNAIDEAVQAVTCLVENGVDVSMNRYNGNN